MTNTNDRKKGVNIKKKYIFIFICLIINIFFSEKVLAAENNFEIMVRPSPEEHLDNGMISYYYMGISNIWWGTTKFEISVDGGNTWFYAYCLNNDLENNDSLNNKILKDFEATYNNDNLKKILYYGFNKSTWDKEGYDLVRKDYHIWMPQYKNGVLVASIENETEDLAYCLTHLALSYSYYYDVLGLSEEESEERAFYSILENEDIKFTKARTVAKLWYKYLISKPTVGIKISSSSAGVIDSINSNANNPKTIKFAENIELTGNKINDEQSGRIEFIVPNSMECEVIGEEAGASNPGIYPEGTKLILGADQKFNLKLVKIASDNSLNIDLYEKYNIAKIDGGFNEDGKEFQDITGMYKSDKEVQKIVLRLDDNVRKLNVTKKVLNNGKPTDASYYISIYDSKNIKLDTIEINMDFKNEVTKTIYFPLNNGETIYYIKETDKDGNILSSSDLVKIEIDNEKIVFSEDSLEKDITIVNNYIVTSPDTGINISYTIFLLATIGGIYIIYNIKKRKKIWKI